MAEFSFDVEAYRQYTDDVIKSQLPLAIYSHDTTSRIAEGFYVSSDYGYNLVCGIVKINENDIVHYQGAERATLFAVDEYSKKEKLGSLKYMRIVNLNMEPVAGAMYYITLAAMERTFGDVYHYQAKVWEKIHTGFQAQIFKKAPYAVRQIETSMEDHRLVGFGNLQPIWKDENCLWIRNLKPWMDENYLYYSCFDRVNELVSVKVICNEETGKSEGLGLLWFITKSAAEEVLNAYNRTQMPNASQCYSIDWAKLQEVYMILLEA